MTPEMMVPATDSKGFFMAISPKRFLLFYWFALSSVESSANGAFWQDLRVN